MKSLLLPTFPKDRKKRKFTLPSITLAIKYIVGTAVLVGLLWSSHYVWALLFLATAIVGNYAFQLYKEICAIDLSVGDINFTLEELIEDLEY